jgi:ABC-2 type transport system permease protein
MNSLFTQVIRGEYIKVRRSKILYISITLFAFIGLMLGFLMYAAKHPEIAGKSATLGTKASLISKADWPSFLNLLIQMVLAVGYLGSGFVAIWIFGREYTERVMKDLLCMPVPKHYFVAAKFILIFIWSILLLIIMLLASLITGAFIGLDGWNWDVTGKFLAIYCESGLLTLLLSPLAALIACISRGLLMPIVYLLLTMIITQFSFIAVPPFTPYLPWAIPALSSGIAGIGLPNAGPVSYFILVLTAMGGFAGTSAWLRYADHK